MSSDSTAVLPDEVSFSGTDLEKVKSEILARMTEMEARIIANIDRLFESVATSKQVKDPKMWFDAETLALLDIVQEGDKYIIKPKRYLGSDTYRKVAGIIRKNGGTYISAGRDSRFEVKI